MTILPLLSALACLALQDPPTLLSQTPEDWRYEKIEFPLSFAPELDYGGYEELRFAPGMFDAASDSYFSYVFAIEIADDVAVDEAFVETFLDAYYRGLCRAVAGSRDIEIDLGSFRVAVQPRGVDFLAEIDMVDPFVTGKALKLHLELLAQAGPRTTELFGMASPAPGESPIWKDLRALGETWRGARRPPVLLNHVFIVPDRETYDALAGSSFLRTLAPFEQRDTVRGDLSYSGIYFYGRNTYFEFLPPTEGVPQLAQGSTGVAFGVEAAGATATLSKGLEAEGIRTFQAPLTREVGDRQVPWFLIMGVEQAHPTSRLSVFSMEYDPGFLAAWHGDKPPQVSTISRRHVLERYAAKLGQHDRYRSGLLRDVSEVHLALDDEERARLLATCRTFGWLLEDNGDGRSICDGPQVRLVVTRSEGPGGVVGFTLALRHPVDPATIELGRARLTLQGTSMTLTLTP